MEERIDCQGEVRQVDLSTTDPTASLASLSVVAAIESPGVSRHSITYIIINNDLLMRQPSECFNRFQTACLCLTPYSLLNLEIVGFYLW